MTLHTGPLEERQRKYRNIVFSSLFVLIILWIFKLSYPQFSIISSFPSTPIPTTVDTSPGAHNAPPTLNDEEGKYKLGEVEPTIALAGENFNGTVQDKAAVIIETRFRQNLIPLILHFSAVLGPQWPVLIYTSAESVGQFSASAALARYLRLNLIQIRILPQTVLFTDSDSVSAFLTNSWIWESLAPAEYILLFQSDSMLCGNAARSVEDYFDYDFIGAPIRGEFGKGYNGGLSLRKRSSFLRVLGTWDWEETKKDGDRFEDQWFYNRFKELQEEEAARGLSPENRGAINLPSVEIARTFSVESIEYPHPLGVHQVHRFLAKEIPKLDTWCPEYKLCSEDGDRVPA